MLDAWLGEINLANLFVVFLAVVILPLQLLLCFRVRSKLLRALPAMLLTVAVALCLMMLLRVTGWDALYYVVGAAYTGAMLLMSLLGWGIWLLCVWRRKRT